MVYDYIIEGIICYCKFIVCESIKYMIVMIKIRKWIYVRKINLDLVCIYFEMNINYNMFIKII